jgi:3-hydroxybutyrate dehydrogenase
MKTLAGKVAAVTGSTGGIGLGIATALHEAGARVVVNGRNEERGAKVLAEIGGGANVHFICGDAANGDDVKSLVRGTVDRYGQIDIMVANAGGPIIERFIDSTDETVRAQLDLNLNQVIWAMRSSLQYMLPRKSGRIIVISSLDGKVGGAGRAIYSACKHGVNGLVKAVAKEVGTSGVTVNAICPGAVLTEQGYAIAASLQDVLGYDNLEELVAAIMKESAIQRPLTPEEVGSLAVYLASDASSGITGSLISVDGGAAPY